MSSPARICSPGVTIRLVPCQGCVKIYEFRGGQDNRKMKKRIAVAIVSTLLVILSLYAVNAVILGQQNQTA